MKQLLYSALFALALTLVSCTTNNGDIGPLMGRWKVAEITCDGVTQSDYEGNIFFAFQSTVFEMSIVYGNHENEQKLGAWSETDGGIVVSFPYDRYVPYAVTHFTQERNVLKFDAVKKQGFTMTMVGEDGHTYAFHLIKW